MKFISMKRDRTQQRLDSLRSARLTPNSSESIAALREALRDSSNYVVAKAAEIVEQGLVGGLVPDLLDAYDRMFANPAKDKGCEALTAIAKALYALDYQSAEPYLRGIRHKQMEGSFGPPTDVATGLRSVCGLALVHTQYAETIDELTLLLTDEYAPVRLSAARALGCTGLDACIPLLKFKVYVGDPEFEVVAECMASMLALSVSRSLAFVVEQLDSSYTDRSEAAAVALGTVRDEKAFEALRTKWDSTAFGEIRERILDAMAASRTDQAIEFLIGLVADEPARTAAMAVKALAIHRRDAKIHGLVREAAAKRGKDLDLVVSSAFGIPGTV